MRCICPIYKPIKDDKITVEEVVKYQALITAMEQQLFDTEADQADVMVV